MFCVTEEMEKKINEFLSNFEVDETMMIGYYKTMANCGSCNGACQHGCAPGNG